MYEYERVDCMPHSNTNYSLRCSLYSPALFTRVTLNISRIAIACYQVCDVCKLTVVCMCSYVQRQGVILGWTYHLTFDLNKTTSYVLTRAKGDWILHSNCHQVDDWSRKYEDREYHLQIPGPNNTTAAARTNKPWPSHISAFRAIKSLLLFSFTEGERAGLVVVLLLPVILSSSTYGLSKRCMYERSTTYVCSSTKAVCANLTNGWMPRRVSGKRTFTFCCMRARICVEGRIVISCCGGVKPRSRNMTTVQNKDPSLNELC